MYSAFTPGLSVASNPGLKLAYAFGVKPNCSTTKILSQEPKGIAALTHSLPSSSHS